MIKKLSAVLLVLVLLLPLYACGGGAEAKYSLKSIVGYEPLDFIKLGKYTGIAVDLTTTDNQTLVKSRLSKYHGVKFTDRAVEKGDTVNIAYTGRLKSSGETFKGGSSESYDLTIGSGKFISGFEDGLIGVTPGQTVDLNLAFPDPYPNNPDLAGVPVIFTVTVHYITGHSDEEKKIAQNSAAAASILTEIANGSTYTKDLPEDVVNEKVEAMVNNLSNTASYYGMKLDEYLTAAYNTTEAQIRIEARSYAEKQVKQEIAMYAIAEVDDVKLTDEKYNSMLSLYAAAYGYESGEKFKEAHGEDNIRKHLLTELIYSHLVEINNVKLLYK